MAKHFDADQDYDDFEAWWQERSDEQLGQMMFGFLDTLKPGTVLTRDGHDSFRGWAYDVRWPEIREARECDRLSFLSDMASMARRAA